MSVEDRDVTNSPSTGLRTPMPGVNGRGRETLSVSGELVEETCATSKTSSRLVSKSVPGLIPAYLLTASDLFAISNRDNSSSEDDIRRLDAGGSGNAEKSPLANDGKQQPRTLPKSSWNGKERTPMCLVNELSRFNKVECDYILTDEQGPAHKKVFYVTLKIGSETYSAMGHSIKKAQHNAATLALTSTAYRCPSVSINQGQASTVSSRQQQQQQQLLLPATSGSPVAGELKITKPVLTPTVELNALAARLGQQPCYYQLDSYVHLRPALPTANDLFQGFRYAPQHPARPLFTLSNMDYLGPFSSQFPGLLQPHLALPPQPVSQHKQFCMAVRLGDREFVAEGATRQLARHNVAAKALTALRAMMPVPSFVPASPSAAASTVMPASASRTDAGDAASFAADGSSSASGRPHSTNAVTDTGRSSPYYHHHHKSEINALHEVARRLCLTLSFDVGSEVGPPHQRHFVTRCICGDHVSEGSGNSKRSSKKDAASRMLQRLCLVYPVSAVLSVPSSSSASSPSDSMAQPGKGFSNRSRARSLMKVHKLSADYGSTGINPITRLAQIQQAKEQPEPVYQLLPSGNTCDLSPKDSSDSRISGRKHFTVKVTMSGKEAIGSGPNKRVAKRNAAEAMLVLIGCSRPHFAIVTTTPAAAATPVKSLLKTTALSVPAGDACLENSQQQTPHSGGSEKRVTFLDQCSPGGTVAAGGHTVTVSLSGNSFNVSSDAVTISRPQPCSLAVLSKMAKELLESGCSRVARALLANSGAVPATSSTADNALAGTAAASGRRSRPKEQLEYLAQAAGSMLDFVDVPQGTSKEGYLALVTIMRHPPITGHGTGATVDEAYDAAALAVLQQLAAGIAAKLPSTLAGADSPVGACNRPIILRRPTAADPPGQRQTAEQAPDRNLLVEQAVKVEQ